MAHKSGMTELSLVLALLMGLGLQANPVEAQSNGIPAAVQGAGAQVGAGATGERSGSGAPNRNGIGANRGGRQAAIKANKRLGPAWQKGADGAQNARRLKRSMKPQERRERSQYEQAMMQVKEQQQQEYEKQMLQKLGSQRPDIQQSRNELKRVRQQTGANSNN